jgi:hypothetical protein
MFLALAFFGAVVFLAAAEAIPPRRERREFL